MANRASRRIESQVSAPTFELWMRAISHDPQNVETLREILRDHSEHVIHTGVAMTNLWVNMQQQMANVK